MSMPSSLRSPATSRALAVALTALVATACPGDDGEDTGGDGSTSAAPTTGPQDDESGTVADTEGTGACGSPGAWSAPDFDTNAAEGLALRAQLDALTGDATMRGAETGAVAVEMMDLVAAWDGDPSLAAVANPGYAPVVEACFDEFLDVIAAGPQELMMDGSWAPGPEGGIWGDDSRGINEGGVEVRQFVDKAGFSGGILYAYALSQTEGAITPATIEDIAGAWGSNASLDPGGELTDAADYALEMGFFAEMSAALNEAHAFAGIEQCAAERDAALVTFFQLWEQSMLARLVFYGNRAEANLLAATDGTGFADALHDLAEGVALAAGFTGLPDPTAGPLAGQGRIISDAQVADIMSAFGIRLDDLGASTTGTFVESLPDLEAAVSEAEGVVMDAYGVDAATIMTWVMPTPG